MTTGLDGPPLRIDAAAYSPFGEARLVVELAGRWLEPPLPVERSEPAQLLLEKDGQTHSFPEIASTPDPERAGEDVYGASFIVPAQFEGRLGRSLLYLPSGRTATVPPAMWTMVSAQAESDYDEPGLPDALRSAVRVPPAISSIDAHRIPGPDEIRPVDEAPEFAPELAPEFAPELAPEFAPELAPEFASELAPEFVLELPPAPEPPSALAPEPALHEVPARGGVTLPAEAGIVALRAELRERVATETRLRRTISELRAQLDARVRNQERLDATQAQLRASFAQLREQLAVDGQRRAELEADRQELRASHERLEAANAELARQLTALSQRLVGAEGARDHLAAELDAALDRLAGLEADLAAAAVARESAAGEVEELRHELDSVGAEIAISREPVADDELDDAEALLAETRALIARFEAGATPSSGVDGHPH
jgi:hypothetical protein